MKRIIPKIVTGTWVKDLVLTVNVGFVLYMVALMVFYIFFVSKVEKTQRDINELKREAKTKRAEYISTSSEVFRLTLERNILNKAKEKGLELYIPVKENRVIKINKEEGE